MRTLAAVLWASVMAAGARAEAPCRLEDGLSEAAAIALLAEDGHDPDSIRRALLEVKSDVVGARALFVPSHGDDEPASDAASAWLTSLAARVDAPLVCGRASGERGELVIAAPRAAELRPLKRNATRVFGWLAPDFEEPVLVALGADGQLSRKVISRAMLASGIPLAADLARPARLQLLASGRFGPRPVAERVAPGADPDAGRRSDLNAISAPDPQAPVSGLLNRLRRARGLHPLRRHRLLRDLAAEHARRVCESGHVAHALTAGADPEARLEAQGVRAQRVGEAVARAAGPAAAFAALTRSPSHLLALLEPGFTDAGVGVARDARERACLVVLLARWPRFVGH